MSAAAGSAQRLDGLAHVVQRLEEENEVVRAMAGELGGVGVQEADAALQAGVSGVGAGVRDRAGIGVEPVDVDVQERLGDGDRGEALTAADVGDARVP